MFRSCLLSLALLFLVSVSADIEPVGRVVLQVSPFALNQPINWTPFTNWYLDIDNKAPQYQDGAYTSSRNVLQVTQQFPGAGATWLITKLPPDANFKTYHTIQCTAGNFVGWYLDIDIKAPIVTRADGSRISNALILTKQKPAGGLWTYYYDSLERSHLFKVGVANTKFSDQWFISFDTSAPKLVDGKWTYAKPLVLKYIYKGGFTATKVA